MKKPVMKHEKKFEALAARAKALDAKIAKANSVSASHKRAIDQLVADVESYNATTKRFDIAVQRAVVIKPVSDDSAQARAHTLQGFGGQPIYYSHHPEARMISTGDKSCTCPPCPVSPTSPHFGLLCWLEDGGCNLDCSVQICTYRCIRIIRWPL